MITETDKKLKIVVLVDKELPTDHSFIQGVIEKELPNIGVDVTFVGYKSDLPIKSHPNLHFEFVPAGSENFFFKKVHKIRYFTTKILESGPYDILYSRNDPVFLVIAWWLKYKGAITGHFHQISHLHAFSKSDRSLLYRAKSFGDLSLRKKYMQFADKILVISDQMKIFLEKEWPIFGAKYLVYPLGVAVSDFENPIEFRNRKFDVVYIGTLASSRRIDILIDAISIHNQKYDAVKLHIWGGSHNPKDDAKLIAYAAEKNGSDAVIFHGKIGRSEVLQNLKNTKIGLSTIPCDGILNQISPTKLMEYLAAGCCVVATNGIPDQETIITEAYDSSQLIDFNAKDIAEAIHKLNANLDRAEQMSQKGRDYIFKKRSYSEMALKLKSQMIALVASKR